MLLSKILPAILKNRSLDAEAEAALILEKCKQYIEIYLGENSKKYLIPTKVVRGKIFISSPSSGWSYKLMIQKMYILKALKNDFPSRTLEIVVKK